MIDRPIDDAIARSKRILALVDDYHDNPTSDTRASLRHALLDEFKRDFEVAEVIECAVMGQQTLREVDGRWRFLKIGEKLYARGTSWGITPSRSPQ